MLANLEKWILAKFSYEVKNTIGNKHKWSYIFDFVLLIFYTSVSLYNAFVILFPSKVLVNNSGGVPSFSVLVLNFIILLRLNISIHIKKEENVNAALKKWNYSIIKEVDIKTWFSRLAIIYVGYIVDVIITIYYFAYGQVVSDSLAVIGIVAIIETFINSFLDNLIARYEAVPDVFIKVQGEI